MEKLIKEKLLNLIKKDNEIRQEIFNIVNGSSEIETTEDNSTSDNEDELTADRTFQVGGYWAWK